MDLHFKKHDISIIPSKLTGVGGTCKNGWFYPHWAQKDTPLWELLTAVYLSAVPLIPYYWKNANFETTYISSGLNSNFHKYANYHNLHLDFIKVQSLEISVSVFWLCRLWSWDKLPLLCLSHLQIIKVHRNKVKYFLLCVFVTAKFHVFIVFVLSDYFIYRRPPKNVWLSSTSHA